MQDYKYIIVGGGLTAASAVDGIREVDPDGSIIILSDEEIPPYHRPPLTKEFLQAPDAPRALLHVKPEDWFDKQRGVTLVTGAPVESLEPQLRVVSLQSGEGYRGERLLLATGGRARTLDLEGSDLENVFALRTVEDSEAIRSAAGRTERAVLIGAGFIGMELAASLRKYDVASTVVDISERVWPRLFPPDVADFVQGYYEDRGIDFRLGQTVGRLEGEDQVERVVLDSGEVLPCDLVVVGVGLVPNDQLAARAGLAVYDGIVVDSYGESTAGHVYAAGDVARFPDPISGELVRVEHWDHAKAHGKLVGRNMAGEREPYDHLSYFFTHAFDLSISAFGEPGRADRIRIDGRLGPEHSVVYCLEQDRVTGAILINANDALDEVRERVRSRTPADALDAYLGEPDPSGAAAGSGAEGGSEHPANR